MPLSTETRGLENPMLETFVSVGITVVGVVARDAVSFDVTATIEEPVKGTCFFFRPFS